MNDPLDNPAGELSWRRQLTAAETARLQRHLADHPEDREVFAREAELNRLLAALPEAPPVASNFTAQVLGAVRREKAMPTRSPGWFRWLSSQRWLPRAAMASLVLGFSLLAYHRHEMTSRAMMAGDVANVAAIVSASGPEIMENFDAIQRMGSSPAKADMELLALMK